MGSGNKLQRQKKSLGKRKQRDTPKERGERETETEREREHKQWVLRPEGFYPLFKGKDLRRGPRGGSA